VSGQLLSRWKLCHCCFGCCCRTQTPTDGRRPWEGKPGKFSRDTQTVKTVSRSCQAKREASTQMERPGLSIDSSRDRVIVAGAYLSADQLDEIRWDKVMLIQRCWRGFVARQAAARIRESQLLEAEEAARAEAEAHAAEMEQHRKEVERRIHPRSAKDFAALYGEIEAWRQSETAKVKESLLTEEEKKEALAQLLAKQTTMLATVDKLRTEARQVRRDERIAKSLDAMSKPRMWQASDGAVVEIHTPFSTRAAELKALFEALTANPADLGSGVPEEEVDVVAASSEAEHKAGTTPTEMRVQVLLQVKFTVKEFDCGLTREIVELIDRETDLLARGRPLASMSALRKRTSNLFLQFIETPEFNPEAARFQKVPRDLATRPNVMPIVKG
jgi:hypothetical protein